MGQCNDASSALSAAPQFGPCGGARPASRCCQLCAAAVRDAVPCKGRNRRRQGRGCVIRPAPGGTRGRAGAWLLAERELHHCRRFGVIFPTRRWMILRSDSFIGLFLSRSFRKHSPSFFRRFFVRSERPFLRPDPPQWQAAARRSCQGWSPLRRPPAGLP